MKKQFFSFLIIFVILNADDTFSQNFESGTIVKNGVSILGLIKYENWLNSPTKISFKQDISSTEQLISAEEIQSFKVNASAQVQFWSGKNQDIGGSKSKWEGSNKEKVESKQAIGLSVGLKNKLEVGASWERTENNDRNGNKSDAKQKGSIGLTGDLTKGLPIKTGYETETMENGAKPLPTNSILSFSVGGALIIGGEVKIEIKSKN